MVGNNKSVFASFRSNGVPAALAMGAVLLGLNWAARTPFAVSQTQNAGAGTVLPADSAGHVPKKIKDQISHRSGGAMRVAAKAWGLNEIMGKPLKGAGGPPVGGNAKKLKDVGIGVDPVNFEEEPTLAANPKSKSNLVAGSHLSDPNATEAPFVNCVAYRSFDAGATWSSPISMPQLTPTSNCADPVLAFAPDGSRVYYAYLGIEERFTEVSPELVIYEFNYDILVSHSDDGGTTWNGPIIALDGDPGVISFNPVTGEIVEFIDEGFIYDKPWIGTPVDEKQSHFVYVTATRFDQFGDFPSHIVFTRSSAQGAGGLWSSPVILDTGAADPTFVLVQGSRPAGGLGGEVLVAWYNSGPDGFLVGSFNIRTRRSADYGTTWDPVVDASVDSFEAPVFLGPFIFYYFWYPTMFPDVEIDPKGAAHIAYTHDPVANVGCPPPFNFPGCSTTPEDGDIRYITSSGPPYTTWSSPVTVNDDGLERAQGYAALKIQHGGSVNLIWDDHRLSPDLSTSTIEDCRINLINCDSPNLYYDIFYARKVPGQGNGWSRNIRVSDTSSIVQSFFQGDYIDLAANDKLLFGIWTDRRHQNNIGVHDGIIDLAAFEDNVFGSRIIAGGGAP